MKRKRLFYAALFVALVALEIVIGAFVHDRFVWPYLGDVIVVIAIWAFVRILIPKGGSWLSAALFIFALGVEIAQGFHIADLLGIENRILRIALGNSFSVGDIVCYAVGCALCAAWDLKICKIVFCAGKNGKKEMEVNT